MISEYDECKNWDKVQTGIRNGEDVRRRVKGGGGVTHTLKPSFTKKEEIAIPFLVLFFISDSTSQVWKAHWVEDKKPQTVAEWKHFPESKEKEYKDLQKMVLFNHFSLKIQSNKV